MRKKFLPLSMVLITMMLAQIGLVSNAAETQGKYVPRTNSKATISSYMKSIRANQETGLIDPALMLKAQKEAQNSSKGTGDWKVMGPDNYGALTRAMVYDENDATGNTLMIGTMGGHIFKSTNGGITMQQAYDLNTMISCMIQKDGVTFVGTGDGRYQSVMNGLGNIGYATSFVGNGVYKIAKDGTYSLLESTKNWQFVNELAKDNNKIYAATSEGLYCSDNMGESWTVMMSGQATAVRANSAHVLAVVDEDVYIFNNNGNEVITVTDGILLPDPESHNAFKAIAVSQSDVNYMYVAFIDYTVASDGTVSFSTGNIYFSKDGGNEWGLALPATGLYDIFGSYGYTDNAIEVYPNNPRKLLIGGSSFVWTFESTTDVNVYRPVIISSYVSETLLALSSPVIYVHCGIQNIIFNQKNPNVFFVGTEGGVFKGTYASGEYSFRNCNRYFIEDNQHTSVARTFGVGIGGDDNRVLAGSIDHGTILIEGDETLNNMTTGRAIFPHWNYSSNAAGQGHSSYIPGYDGGQCAISTIDPEIMFLTATGSFTTPLFRSETSGEDYDASNFYNADSTFSHAITNANAFRTPFAMYEDYDDDEYNAANNIEMTYQAVDTIPAGTRIYYHSNIGDYPIEGTTPVVMYPGDQCKEYDKLATTMVCGIEGGIYMTKNSHYFDQVSKWWKIGEVNGLPTAVALSSDGDMTFVGTDNGKLYRVSNLRAANTAETAMIDSTSCVVEYDSIIIAQFADRAITGISINGNNVLVTLGNYGNTDYVYYSTDKGNNFTSKQLNLPTAPVYSCLIESSKGTGDLFVGTEYGIYSMRGNATTWTKEGNLSIPVTEIKQALVENHATIADSTVDAVTGDVAYTYYEGVFNEGTIYASTYGNGIIKCNDYRIGGSDLGVTENNTTVNSFEMSIYPNPVRGTANIKFELSESATVSYQVYDLSGRMIMNNVLGTYAQGENTVTFSTDDLTSGSYIVRVQAGNKTNTSKIMVF